jgi:filamentous hemagglutinin
VRKAPSSSKPGSDVHLTTQTLAAKKDMTQDSDNYLRTQRQTEVGTAIDAKGGITLQAGHDIQARGAYRQQRQTAPWP